jgi:hypothetical protein
MKARSRNYTAFRAASALDWPFSLPLINRRCFIVICTSDHKRDFSGRKESLRRVLSQHDFLARKDFLVFAGKI